MRLQPLISGSMLLLLGTSVGAQTAATPVAPRANVVVSDVVMSDQLLGAPVQSETGEVLGSVEDALVDGASGRLLAIAVKPEASLRADGQLTAVPAEALMPATSSDATAPQRVLRLRRETAALLKDSPGFARERWNDALTPEWMARMREHFAVKSGDAPKPERLSSLVGNDVVDSDQAAVGRVNALALDLGRREVAAAIVTPVEELGSRDRLLPVPFTALRPAQARAESARTQAAAGEQRPAMGVAMRLEALMNAPRFDRGDVPRLRAMLGANDMRNFYAQGAQPRAAGATQRGGAEPQRPATGRSNGARPSTPPKSESGKARGSGSPRAR